MNSRNQATVSLEAFDLDFVPANTPDNAGSSDEEKEEEDYSRDEELLKMQEHIPRDAVELGTLENEVINWTTWETRDHYYVVPWREPGYDWALFAISWDDNWGRYEWAAHARVSGVGDPREAARIMLKALFESWSYDLEDEQYQGYKAFLESV